MRVGRAALDEDAIRLIETNNPDLEFDWSRILKGQGDADVVAVPERRDRRIERERQPSRPSPDRRVDRPARSRSEHEASGGRRIADGTERRLEPAQPPLAPSPLEPGVPEPITAAHARLGFEGLVRLRARYGETMARITDRVADPEQQLQLKTLAERLNPDAWVTDADVAEGLESYESTYEALRGTIGNRRRNPRPTESE